MAFMQSFEKYRSDIVGWVIIAFGAFIILVAILGLLGALFRLKLLLGFVTPK